ncbi:MAG: hypothetical protein WA421_19480, partial [Nitrososphaeraceae archaeon]
MACKGICSRYQALKPYIKKKGGNANNNNNNGRGGRYSIGQKRCQICDLFIKFEGVLCPCCNSKLRTRPRGYCFSA